MSDTKKKEEDLRKKYLYIEEKEKEKKENEKKEIEILNNMFNINQENNKKKNNLEFKPLIIKKEIQNKMFINPFKDMIKDIIEKYIEIITSFNFPNLSHWAYIDGIKSLNNNLIKKYKKGKETNKYIKYSNCIISDKIIEKLSENVYEGIISKYIDFLEIIEMTKIQFEIIKYNEL